MLPVRVSSRNTPHLTSPARGEEKHRFGRIVFLSAVLISILIAPSTAAWASDLQSPFDIAARRDLHGGPLASFTCATPPQPVRDLRFGGYYVDRGAGSSIVNPQAEQAYREATRAITAFENGVTRLSDRYVASKPADSRPAVCGLDWLAVWAEAGAMLGEVTQQGGYVRKWGLAPVAASYLKIRDEAALDPAKKQLVERWVARWARVVRDDYTPTKLESRRNNHVYWAAWSVGLAAIVLDDRALFDWSMDKARLGLAQITPDGTLPLEMARKARAYHYHVFAAAPLVMTAELAARNGVDLYAENNRALSRLVSRVIAGFTDDSFFAAATGRKQDRSGSSKGPHVAWLEPYYARTGDAQAATIIRQFRPMRERRLGGDMTLLYGANLP
jgi:poly(beta-D-mannuronate) lyase